MNIKEKVKYVKDRKEIVDMMEKLYAIGRNGKADLTKILTITNTLNWVIEHDDQYIEDFIKESEEVL